MNYYILHHKLLAMFISQTSFNYSCFNAKHYFEKVSRNGV